MKIQYMLYKLVKKYILIFLLIYTVQIFIAPLQNTIYAENASSAMEHSSYGNDGEGRAKNLVGNKGIVFMTRGQSFYYDGEKHYYSEYTNKPYYDGDVFFVPVSVFCAVSGMECKVDDGIYSIGGAQIASGSKDFVLNGNNMTFACSPQTINGELYLPLKEALERICGLNVYVDDRGMLLSGCTESMTNSRAANKIYEPIDCVYRYMQFERPEGAEILADIKAARPRILTTPDKLKKTKELINSGKISYISYAYFQTLYQADDILLYKPLTQYSVPDGVRLLESARQVLKYVQTLSAAYLLTGDTKYAERCYAEMENACNWKDWNASNHYLDNSELAYAMAIGFDSIYDYINKDENKKKFIIEKTIEYSLSHTANAYRTPSSYNGSEWRYASGNWGAVCPGGAVAACIAFAGEDFSGLYNMSAYILGEAIHSLEYPLMLFYPDGAWSEGMEYWQYTSDYLFGAAIGSIYHSTGKTYSLLEPEGVSDALLSALYLQSNKNGSYNYADSSKTKILSSIGYLIAELTSNTSLMEKWRSFCMMSGGIPDSLASLRYFPSEISTQDLTYDKYFSGAEIGIMKSAWNKDGIYVGAKGGLNNTNHDNLDLGSFIFESEGVRWAIELGSDDYNIEGGYWGLPGYELYRKRPEGQNCVVINPRNDIYGEYYGQNLNGYAPLIKKESNKRGAYMIYDLQNAYNLDTSSYKRGFYLGDDRTSLIIQDEMSLVRESEIYWFMHTVAEDIIISEDKKSATLFQNGKQITVDAVCTADNWYFDVLPATPFDTSPQRDGQNTNNGIRKLTIVAHALDDVDVSVKLTPGRNNTLAKREIVPISSWSIPEGEIQTASFFRNLYDSMIISKSDFKVKAHIGQSFQSANLLLNGESVCEIKNSSSGEYAFTIPAMHFSDLCFYNVSLEIDGEEKINSVEICAVDVGECVNSHPVIDFENKSCVIGEMNSQGLYDIYGAEITLVEESEPSAEIISYNSGKAFKLTSTKKASSSSYIQRYVEPFSNGIVTSEFDIVSSSYGALAVYEPRMSSTTDNYMYFGENKSQVLSIFSSSGKLGESGYYYVPGREYHITVTLDLVNGRYKMMVRDGVEFTDSTVISEGKMTSSDPDNINLDFRFWRVAFRNYYGMEPVYCILDNFRLYHTDYFTPNSKSMYVKTDFYLNGMPYIGEISCESDCVFEAKVLGVNSFENSQGILIFALYNDNELVFLKKEDVTFSNKFKTITIPFEKISGLAQPKLKLFYLNSIENLTPYIEAFLS